MRDADRLYDLLPAALRARDAEVGQPLRALMAIMSDEIGAIGADIETTWDNWFIETCEEWLVPYLGEALGVRGMRDVDAADFSLRGYVANTLERRRRKGTLAATEQLARDVTGYPARAIEMFALTATSAHVNHVRLQDERGVVRGSADLRDTAALLDVSGPFDPFVRTPDVRAMAGNQVRHNLPNVGLFLWRLRSQELSAVTARVDPTDPRWFRFDALGADRPVFTLPVGERTIVSLAGPEHVPRPISRLELGGFGPDDDWPVAVRVEASTAAGLTVTDLTPIVCHLGGGGALPARVPPDADHVLVDPELGRLVVHPDVVAGPVEVVVDLVHGAAGEVGAGPYDRNGRLEALGADVSVAFQCGVARRLAPVGSEAVVATLEQAVTRWNTFIAGIPVAQRSGTAGSIVVMDSRTHAAPTTPVQLPDGATLSIVAAQWPRTEVDGVLARHVGVLDANRLRPHVLGDLVVSGQASPGLATAGGLVLDGLLVEGAILVRPGQLERLVLRSCTLAGGPEGIHVERGTQGGNAGLGIVVDRSVLPAVVSDGPIAALQVEASFVGTPDRAVDLPGARLDAQGATILGRVRCQVLEASDCIFDEGAAAPASAYRIAETQQGCVRFSHVPVAAATPRRYRCQPDLALAAVADPAQRRRIARAVHPVLSTDLADPGFGLLAVTSHPALRTAGSDGCEPGMWHHLQHARRMANLRLALDQDLRYGLDAGFVLDR